MRLEDLKNYRYSIRHYCTDEEKNVLREVERFVNEIPDDYVRPMISARYIDGLTWSEVCTFCCPYLLPDCCRMIVRRYLKSIGVT